MSKWKIACGGLVAVVVLVAVGGWWIYRWWQPNGIEIRNGSNETIYVTGNPIDTCPAFLIAAQSTLTYKDDSLLCRKPRLTFHSPFFSAGFDCDWSDAENDEPVEVTDFTVSCASPQPEIPATPVSPPSTPRSFPSPTPER